MLGLPGLRFEQPLTHPFTRANRRWWNRRDGAPSVCGELPQRIVRRQLLENGNEREEGVALVTREQNAGVKRQGRLVGRLRIAGSVDPIAVGIAPAQHRRTPIFLRRSETDVRIKWNYGVTSTVLGYEVECIELP